MTRRGSISKSLTDQTSCLVWTREEFVAKFGRAYDRDKDYVDFINVSNDTNGAHVEGASVSSTGNIYALLQKETTGTIKLGFICMLGA